MLGTARLGKTIAFAGFLLGCLGMVFPLLKDYRGYNGIECALLFLNKDETVPYFALLTSFFFASGIGIVFCIRRDHWLFFLLPSIASASTGLWLFSIFGFRLFPMGWMALIGALLQMAGSVALAAAARRNA